MADIVPLSLSLTTLLLYIEGIHDNSQTDQTCSPFVLEGFDYTSQRRGKRRCDDIQRTLTNSPMVVLIEELTVEPDGTTTPSD